MYIWVRQASVSQRTLTLSVRSHNRAICFCSRQPSKTRVLKTFWTCRNRSYLGRKDAIEQYQYQISHPFAPSTSIKQQAMSYLLNILLLVKICMQQLADNVVPL